MKDWSDRIIAAFHVIFGAFIGIGVYMFLFSFGMSKKAGWIPFLLFTCAGGVVGWINYGQRHRQIDISVDGLDEADHMLLVRRIGVVVFCVAGLYFLWDFAMGAK